VLVGGSVRVPLVVRTLEETLPVSPLGFDKRDVAVALGAAHYTSIRWPGPRGPETGAGIEARSTTTDSKPLGHQYQVAVEQTFSDKKLSKVEVDRLNAFAGQLGLSREQTVEVERRVMGNSKEGILFQQYRRAVEMVWADEELDGLEVEWLGALAEELGLNQHQISYAESAVMGDTKEAILERQSPSLKDSDETANFALACTLIGHSGGVHSVAFSPDAELLVSCVCKIRGWRKEETEAVAAPGFDGEPAAGRSPYEPGMAQSGMSPYLPGIDVRSSPMR
jgi:hypothetical protein